MPKTKKQSKKSPSLLTKLTSKLAGLDSKGKFLLFIVVFVAIGGSYFAYKSFAATGGLSLSAANATLRDGSYLITESGQNSKKNTKVAVIPTSKLGSPGYNASVGFSGGYTSIPGTLAHFLNNNRGRDMRLCAFVRAPRTAANLQMINAYGGWEFKPLPVSTTNYSHVCTNYQKIQAATNGYSIPEVRSGGASAMIYVSSLSIEVIN